MCAQAATCTEPAQYYVQCDRCDVVSETLTVAAGDSLGHSYQKRRLRPLRRADAGHTVRRRAG
ncbi:MAG: hypothetical protein V8S57_06375 [Oscillospiraceae bacterium]